MNLVNRLILLVLLLVFFVIGFISYNFYLKIFSPNVNDNNTQPFVIYIPTNSNFDSVKSILFRSNIIIDTNSFLFVSKIMKYKSNIHPGRYFIQPTINNRQLVQLLRSGKQTPLTLIINNIRTKEELVSLISSKLEVDSILLLNKLNDEIFLKEIGFDKENSISLFIPNTYEFYWDTDENELIYRMIREYKKFWNPSRTKKAMELNLPPLQIITLASIVEQETIKENEKKIIAGVYINRLQKKWKLQADPTVKFALGRFDLQRVLNEHLAYDSPFNTYFYEGLPPGPICLPETKTIDAVLNYEHHNYMYFCAKEDFSGYHNFSVSLTEHLANARKFQTNLNKNKIFK